MKTKLKITDAHDDESAAEKLKKIFTLPNSFNDAEDDMITDDDEVVAFEDACCKDDDAEVENNTESDETSSNSEHEDFKVEVSVADDDYDAEEVTKAAEKLDCAAKIDDEEGLVVISGMRSKVSELLADDPFNLNGADVESIIAEGTIIVDGKDEDDSDVENKEEEKEVETASSADSIFTEEEIRLLKQLAAMAPDLIAAAEKANQEEEAKETAEDPSDELIAGDEEDEDEDEDEEDSQSTTGEMIAEFDDSEDEVEETEETVTTHDSKAAFGSIERRTTAVTDSIDEDLDVIALWNKRYGG